MVASKYRRLPSNRPPLLKATIWIKHGMGGYLIMQQMNRGRAHAPNVINTMLFVQLIKLAAQVHARATTEGQKSLSMPQTDLNMHA